MHYTSGKNDKDELKGSVFPGNAEPHVQVLWDLVPALDLRTFPGECFSKSAAVHLNPLLCTHPQRFDGLSR